MLESALTFPVLLMVALFMVQGALFLHAENVVTAAVQDGARVAAAEDGTVAQGTDYAHALISAGLGDIARQIQIQGIDGGSAVAIQAQGNMRMIIPWVADATLPLEARSVMNKERFQAGPQ